MKGDGPVWDNDPFFIRRRLEMAEELLKSALAKKGTPAYNPDTVKDLKEAIADFKRKLRGK